MLDINGIHAQTNVVHGSFFLRFGNRSRLSIDLVPGRVGAVGIDFSDNKPHETILWTFNFKAVNPNDYPVVLEELSVRWDCEDNIVAQWSHNLDIKPVDPASLLKEDFGDYVPLLIPEKSTAVFEAKVSLRLHKKRFLWLRPRRTILSRSHVHHDVVQAKKIKIIFKTNYGESKFNLI